MKTAKTSGGDLEDGRHYELVLMHGATERPVTGTVRIFDQEGVERCEVILKPATDEPCGQCGGTGVVQVGGEAVGFWPEHVARTGK